MKTIVLETPGTFRLDDALPPAGLNPDEALVKVLRVGICGTDLHVFEGTQPFFAYPRILGHELAVEILATGSPSDLKAGDICAVEPYLNCGTCLACRRGAPNACVNLQVLGVHQDGGMREQITVPLRKLHPTPNIPLEEIAIIEMLSIGAHAVRRAKVEAGENVLVIGAGPIGLGTMQFAQLAGAHVIAMDVNPARLEFCRTHLGIPHTLNALQDPLPHLQELLGGDLPTAVFDATGNLTSMMGAFQYVAHAGRLVYVGLAQGEVTFNDPFFHRREITLLASRNATPADFRQVIEALQTGGVKPHSWITHHATPEQLLTDFASWINPATGVIKAVLEF